MSIPPELYEPEVENAKPLYVFWRLTLPVMAPTLLLLTFRDTIFSLQANFVPALIVTEEARLRTRRRTCRSSSTAKASSTSATATLPPPP